MKNMKLLALLLALVLCVCAVGMAGAEAADDPVLGTAYNGEIAVRASEVKDNFNANLQSYIAMYAQYGYELDEYDVEFQRSVAQDTVQTALTQHVVERYAADHGYVLTAEADEALKAEVQTGIDEMREYLETYLGHYGYTGETLDKMVEEQMAGLEFDAVYENAKLKAVVEYLYGLGTEGVTVTEEEVKAAYAAKVDAQKTAYANVDAFIDAYMNGEEILYTPEGVRLMECIFVAAQEAAEETAEQAADDAAELTGLEKANDIVARIRAGEDFAQLAKTYSEDGTAEMEVLPVYPVAEGTALYGEEFKNGAMALAVIGDVSDVITTEYGYFILRYADDLAAGTVELETRLDKETEEALSGKKNDAFNAYTDKMVEEAGFVINDVSPLFNIFVSETVEAEVAYVTATEATDLTDMPAGTPVAKLSAGASLDVLGKIGVDGEEYAFVNVLGTEMKGYVNLKATANMEPDDALKVDNAALAAACEAVDKLPTFTIAMNDGSVIYGELYPDVTPESVGNFVSLANSGFYKGLTFHRVINGFMIQGGDPAGNGTGGPGYAIRGEFANNGVENSLSHTRGVLSMARSSAMDSAGSQFFIMHMDNDFLDGDYAAFGLVLGGIETVDLIASVPTNSSDKPMTDQVMRDVYVETYGKTYEFTKLED